MKTRRFRERNGDYPPGVTSEDPHFDMPSVGRYKKHRECATCRRMIHPARNCKCTRCKDEN